MTTSRPNRDGTVSANIAAHGHLASTGQYKQSPYFRPENQAWVREILTDLVARHASTGTSRVIDLGCGTGFIINLLVDLVDRIEGVDITPEMMAEVDLGSGKVHLWEALAEETPFDDGVFDNFTAYSLLDHLHDYRVVLAEAVRVLRPGGVFYADLNPNRAFIDAMARAQGNLQDGMVEPGDYSLVDQEIQGALRNGEVYGENHGVEAACLEATEPGKTFDRGFDADEVLEVARAIGFIELLVEHEWFLGQAKIALETSFETALAMADHLRTIPPVSDHLFKYLRFILVR